jgi:hypothetical protein
MRLVVVRSPFSSPGKCAHATDQRIELSSDILQDQQRGAEARLGFAELIDKTRKESSQMPTSNDFWDSALRMDDGEEEEEYESIW